MSIEGQRRVGSDLVPVSRRGQRILAHPDRLKPYSLESAEALVSSVRDTIADNGYAGPQGRPLLADSISQLECFIRAADEVIAVCQQEIDRLEAKRNHLHSADAAENFDSALTRLKNELGRHQRTRARLATTLVTARDAGTQLRARQQQGGKADPLLRAEGVRPEGTRLENHYGGK